jgi:hypothetical protein
MTDRKRAYRDRAAKRNRDLRRRRGRCRPNDIAWMCYVPVTNADIEALERLGLLPKGRGDKASVTAAVQELWARIEVKKRDA